ASVARISFACGTHATAPGIPGATSGDVVTCNILFVLGAFAGWLRTSVGGAGRTTVQQQNAPKPAGLEAHLSTLTNRHTFCFRLVKRASLFDPRSFFANRVSAQYTAPSSSP